MRLIVMGARNECEMEVEKYYMQTLAH